MKLFARAISASSMVLAIAAPAVGQDYRAEFDRQWGLSMIGADAAWAKGLTGAGVLVGVTDTGLQIPPNLHPEFTASYIPGFHYDGFDTGGMDDTNSHGTHVAGIIAAQRDGVGMVGVAPDSYIVPLRMLAGPAGARTEEEVIGITLDFGISNDVRIFNASWGTDGSHWSVGAPAVTNSPLALAYQRLVASDSVIVFATGNDAFDAPSIDAALPYYFPQLRLAWLAVTSVGSTGARASYAQACEVAALWCIAAPGGDQDLRGRDEDGIYSTVLNGAYAYYHGTSMAAPHVSGALAIARQLYPNAKMQDLSQLVLNTATDIGAAGIDPVFGWGMLNVRNLVQTSDAAAGTLYAQRAWSQSAALDQIMDGVAARSITTDASRSYGWWVAPFAGFGSVSGTTDGQRADMGTSGVTGGVEFTVTPEVSLGLFAGGSAGSLRAENGSTANSSGMHAGAVLSYDNKAVFADLTVGVSRFSGTANRSAAPGLSGTVLGAGGFSAGSSSTDTAFWGGAEVGYRFDLNTVEVAPYAFGRVVNQQLGAFGETSTSVLALSASAAGLTTGEIGVGVQLLGSPVLLDELTITPSLDVAYGRRIGDFDRQVTLLGNSLNASAPVGLDVLHLDAAIDLSKIDSPLNVRFGYSAAVSSGAHTHAVKVGLSGSF